MLKAAENLEFEEAARLRDEIKRLEAVDLAVADDPLARQSAIEAEVEATVPRVEGRQGRNAGLSRARARSGCARCGRASYARGSVASRQLVVVGRVADQSAAAIGVEMVACREHRWWYLADHGAGARPSAAECVADRRLATAGAATLEVICCELAADENAAVRSCSPAGIRVTFDPAAKSYGCFADTRSIRVPYRP